MVQLTGFTGENQELEECEIRNLIGVDSFVVSGDWKHWNMWHERCHSGLSLWNPPKNSFSANLELFKGLTVWGMVCLKYWHQKLKRPKIWRTTLSGLTRELRYPVIPGIYLILSRSLINTEILKYLHKIESKRSNGKY